MRNLAVRIGKNTGELMVNLVASPGEFPQFDFARYLKERISPTSIVWTTTTSLSDRYSPEKESVLWGSNYLYEILGKLKFQISAHSFFQTNSNMAERMCQVIEKMTEATGEETVLDVYSGIGTIGLFVARSVREVYGIESSTSAVEDAKTNARLNKVDNAEFVCAKAEDYFDSFSGKELQIAVLDPPRAGVHPKVIASLLKLKPERIIYVSCNPTTLARDLVLLDEEYRIEAVQPIDMFPQTYHIETVVKLKRRA